MPPFAINDRVHAREPYAANGSQRLLSSRDMICREGGPQLVLPVVEQGNGYASTYRVGMRPGASDPPP